MVPISFRAERQRIYRRYFEDLEAVLTEEGLTGLYASLLEHLGLGPMDFREDGERLGFPAYLAALHWVEDRITLPCLGLRLGARKRHATFGLTGMALLTHPTQALAGYFAATRLPHFPWGDALRIRTREDGDWATCCYEATPPALGQFRPLVEQALMTSVNLFSEGTPGLDWSPCEIRFAFPAPDHYPRYADFLPCRYLFGHPRNELVFPVAWGCLPLVNANPTVQAFCTEQVQAMLEREVDRLGLRVSRLLEETSALGALDFETAASRLGLSGHALRVGLAEEQTSFRRLQGAAVVKEAKRLLGDPAISIKEIAYRLGYAQPSSFHRIFAKLTGMAPERYRAQVIPPH